MSQGLNGVSGSWSIGQVVAGLRLPSRFRKVERRELEFIRACVHCWSVAPSGCAEKVRLREPYGFPRPRNLDARPPPATVAAAARIAIRR